VKQNPDQSKHLATACFSLSGISLDVNNLRTETYAADSRIPQVSIGTASEDAHRRDFTINSLFYNLHTGAVEDFVGSGISDLREGLIRTPLPPHETFQDDPLRILRAVRFAARLDYKVHDDIIQTARSSDLAGLLSTKVSRERIGIEVDKMLTAGGAKPTKALALFESMDLLGPVFLPSDMQLDCGGASSVSHWPRCLTRQPTTSSKPMTARIRKLKRNLKNAESGCRTPGLLAAGTGAHLSTVNDSWKHPSVCPRAPDLEASSNSRFDGALKMVILMRQRVSDVS
jgi:tRNA nucleotidyltransferase/poly(A) polymerase